LTPLCNIILFFRLLSRAVSPEKISLEDIGYIRSYDAGVFNKNMAVSYDFTITPSSGKKLA